MAVVVPFPPAAPVTPANLEGSSSYLAKSNNLSDVPDAATARDNLGIDAALIIGLGGLQKNNNLSDVVSASASRLNLGINSTLIGALFDTWYQALPSAPSGSPGWWKDSGIPTYS